MSDTIVRTFEDAYGRHALVSTPYETRMVDVRNFILDYALSPFSFYASYVGRHRHGPGRHPVEWLVDA